MLTSNGERRFPPQFMRRCLRVDAKLTDNKVVLANIVRANFPEGTEDIDGLVEAFRARAAGDKDRVQALDQLLNAVYLARAERAGDAGVQGLLDVLWEDLNR